MLEDRHMLLHRSRAHWIQAGQPGGWRCRVWSPRSWRHRQSWWNGSWSCWACPLLHLLAVRIYCCDRNVLRQLDRWPGRGGCGRARSFWRGAAAAGHHLV